ncbi:glycosyl hydrolase family 18 protein [Clostridium boliviensis]|uniref:Glycosyl hydrolase family 18 protein n=1 Tax=Clostridium boliviensis TaxID=318465 RepID=A0ABU4GRX0_9CLOT|nr:glycosyl hydrolase family 18 protein [Clostridium boliviensis]MDW2800387.1 glycosyl hydrolase family 18 protein [Clostridium boliviensis]
MKIYVVQPGDSVDSIAASQNVPVEALTYDNQIYPPYRLAVGQALYIRGDGPPEDRIPLYVFGYAYPFINPDNLDQTLPFLTDLYVFSYGFTLEGELVPPLSSDEWMIDRALEAGVRPVLTLTPFGPDGRFNNNLVTNLVHNPQIQQRLIWNLGQIMQEKRFGGLDIDFEYIMADDRQAYAEFVKRTTQIMNQFGYQVTVALAPKTSATQSGLLYEGVDYGLLGEAANRVLLMTYEWGYTYGPPMAVAPINMVRKVVDYAITEIPLYKISLGIPNYGYDWPLPYERGVTRAETISNLEAVQIAIENGVEIQFDEEAMSPFFHYWKFGIEHEVWFEDVRSYKAKFDLIKEYGLTGAGYWQIMQFFRANWLLLSQMFEARKVGD